MTVLCHVTVFLASAHSRFDTLLTELFTDSTLSPVPCTLGGGEAGEHSGVRDARPRVWHVPLHLQPHPLNPTPYSPHPTPYTMNPKPYTQHPSPSTLHPTPYTLQPTPYTLNPSIPNLSPCATSS